MTLQCYFLHLAFLLETTALPEPGWLIPKWQQNCDYECVRGAAATYWLGAPRGDFLPPGGRRSG